MVEKKNPNYETSAVNLRNPPEIKKALEERLSFTSHIANLKAVMEAYPEWAELREAEQRLADHDKYIRELIDDYGSYQDVDKGEYALLQRRESIIYKPELTKKVLEPKLASLVIVESVDSKALDGLVKGGLVSPIEARKCGAVKETFAHIIKQ